MKHRTVCTQCAAGPVPVAHGVGSVGREPESSRLQAALTGLPEGDRWGHGGVRDTSKPEGSAVWSCRLLPGLLCFFLLLMLSKVGTDGGRSVAVMPLACCVTAAAFMGLPLWRQEVFCHPKAMERGNAYPMAVFCEGFSGTQTFIGPSSHGEGSIHAPALRMEMENITVLKEGLGDFEL